MDDCFCDIQTLEKFNKKEIFPILQLLVKQNFFRYYKVRIHQEMKKGNQKHFSTFEILAEFKLGQMGGKIYEFLSPRSICA